MNPDVFFSRGRQLRISLARDLRYSLFDWICGPVCVLAGFYFFRTVGRYRIYDVVTPFVITEAVVGIIAFYISRHEMRGLTMRFYKNLARDRALAWDARFFFLLLMIAYLEGVAILGAHWDLGGLGLVDEYRFHPPFFVLPIYTVAVVLWCMVAFRSPFDETKIAMTLAFAVLPFLCFNMLLPSWARKVVAGEFNPVFSPPYKVRAGTWAEQVVTAGFEPARGMPLWLEWMLAGVILGLSAFLFVQGRRMWLHPYQGE